MSNTKLITNDFESLIKKWFANSVYRGEYLALNQIANITFGKGDGYYTKRTNDVIKSMAPYFQRSPHSKGRNVKYCVDWKQVECDYPEIVRKTGGRRRSPTSIIEHKGPRLAEMTPEEQIIKAYSDEVRDAGRFQHGQSVQVSIHGAGESIEDSWLYQARIVKVHSDEFIFEEGAPILVQWPNNNQTVDADLLRVDNEKGAIAFSTSKQISPFLLGEPTYIRLSTQHLINSLSGRVQAVLEHPSGFVTKLLNGVLLANTIEPPAALPPDLTLDQTQRAAVNHALEKDLTILWGPPGTGKTYVLAHQIAFLALSGRRVLVTSISNIAVDQVALKVVQTLENLGNHEFLRSGKLLRYGRAKMPEVIETDSLFPGKRIIENLRVELKALLEQLSGLEHNLRAYSIIQLNIISVRKKIKEASKERLDVARVIFSTSAQVAASTDFELEGFDTVVIDEASMMPLPTVLGMAGFASKSLVVAGDPKQLGPITISSSPAAQEWLHLDFFSKLAIEEKSDSNACVMLHTQRRMDPEICNLINPIFYQNKLIDDPLDLHPVKVPNVCGPIVNILSTKGPVEFTKGGSRRNEWTASLLIKYLASYARKNSSLQIGVIAPYRAQVSLLKEKIKEHPRLRVNLERKLLRISTIHTFQGSEQDIVFYDMVDTSKSGAGQLYKGEAGSRLVNVAISRAKSHLVIVGDLELLLDQRISTPLTVMRKSLKKYQIL